MEFILEFLLREDLIHRQFTYQLKTIILSNMQSPKSNYRHISYKKNELPIYQQLETNLMKELGLDFSGLHKTAVKHLHNSRIQNDLQLL